jgi:alpha-L-fucosidase 2
MVGVDIEDPTIYIDGVVAQSERVKHAGPGFHEIVLKQGETVTFTPVPLTSADLRIAAVPIDSANSNLFGLSEKTRRLPGDRHYTKGNE